MKKNLHILTSNELREFQRGAIFSRKISELHQHQPIDTIFVDPIYPYQILRAYCHSNYTKIPIEIQDIIKQDQDIISSYFSTILKYIEKQPNKSNIAFLSEANLESLVQLTKLLNNISFNVEKYEISSEDFKQH